MAFSLPRLLRAVAIVTKEGWPTDSFQLWWQSVVEKIEKQIEEQEQVIADLAVAQADLATAQADIIATQAAIGVVEGDISSLVVKDQTPAWAVPTGTLSRTTFATYAAPNISAAYTEAEVQALADHVEILSQRLGALLTDLNDNDVLT